MSSPTKWTVKKLSLADLHVADCNPRVISNRNFQGLKNSLKRFGQVEPIVWNERTGKIVGGHQRFRVLVDSGIMEALVLVVSMTPEEEEAARLTLNNPVIEGEFDEPIGDLLKHLSDESSSLFKELNFEALQSALEKELNKKLPGSSPEPPESSGFKTKCPCCQHEWEVSVADVSVEKA
jgi:hypothetical protein